MAERKLAEQAQASGSPAPPPNELTLAEEFDALNAREAAAKKPPTSAPAGCPTPASFAGVGVSSAKKPPASAVEACEPFATKEAITA
jgi:hypothetical protein